MATISKETMQQTVDALVAAEGNRQRAANTLGIAATTFKWRLNAAQQAGIKPAASAHRDTVAGLRQQIKSLTTELSRTQQQALTDAAIKQHIIQLKNDAAETSAPMWTLTPRGAPSAPGVPTLLCSDWHCGEVVQPSQINGVNEYNIPIFRERVQTLAESAIHLLEILDPKFRYPGLVMPLGGDMCSGNIHDELTATNELNSMPTVLELFATIKWLINYMLERFPCVFLPCVTGNHGRDTHKIWNKDRHATSFDWLLYQLLAKEYEGDKRVVFQIPDGPDANYKIFTHRYLLTHGDQFRGGDSMIGAIGPLTRGDHKKRTRNSQIDMSYDTLVCGHWHQDIFFRHLIVNPSLKGYDEYAFNNNFRFEPPAQQLWVTHPKYGITYRMPVLVDRRRKAMKSDWVSFSKGV